MTKKKKSEPKKAIAFFLIIYIILVSWFTYNNIMDKTGNQKITGEATGIVAINILSRCNMNLNAEYNLISICSEVSNLSVRKILESIDGKYSFVLKWNKISQNFEIFSPEASTNDFEEFNLNESYFIFMNQNTNLNIAGNDFNDVNLTLNAEYEAPSYPYSFTSNITKYLGPIQNDISFALKWNKTDQKFVTYSSEAAINEFETINSGEGQIIYVINPTTLKYNKTLLKP